MTAPVFSRLNSGCFLEPAHKKHAEMRRKRLENSRNNWCAAVALDVVFGALPWVVATCGSALGLWAIHENVESAPETFAEFDSPAAIAAISTFSAFLIVSKIQANLQCNQTIITEFGNLTGSLINLALWVKAQMGDGKHVVETLRLPDGNGGCFITNKIGMTLASVPYAVKYAGRGATIVPEGLPIGQSPALVETYKQYTTRGQAGSSGQMEPFAALVLMIGEQIDEMQRSEKKDSEYAVLFAQLSAVTAAEGAIGAQSRYSAPITLDALLFVVFVLYLGLALISDLVPKNGLNAIWIASIVVLCTIVFFQISARYANPILLRRKQSGQDPLVSKMCVSTEIAILAIFSRGHLRPPSMAEEERAPEKQKLRFKFP